MSIYKYKNEPEKVPNKPKKEEASRVTVKKEEPKDKPKFARGGVIPGAKGGLVPDRTSKPWDSYKRQ